MFGLKISTLVYRSLSGTAPLYLATAVSLSLMRLDVGCVGPTRGRVSSDGLTASSVRDVWPLHAPSCGTLAQFNKSDRR